MSAVTADQIASRIPIFLTKAGPRSADSTHARVANFIVDPTRPDLLSIACPSLSLDLNREGVQQGLSESWTTPDGQVTVSPCGSDGERWLVINLDIPSLSVSQVSFRLDRIADFLAMADALLDFTSDRFADEIAAWMGAVLGSMPPEVSG